MRVDNYTRGVLTVIALCLLYLCVRQAAPPVSAQDAPTRVVITGIALDKGAGTTLPVRIGDPVEIRTSTPLKVEAEHPLPVRAIKEPGTQRPGEN